MVVKMAVGPSAPPMMPNEPASWGVNPKSRDTSSTAKMPIWAAAPKMASFRLRSMGPKSVSAPTPMKMMGGSSPLLMSA